MAAALTTSPFQHPPGSLVKVSLWRGHVNRPDIPGTYLEWRMILGNRSVAYPPEQMLWALGSLCKLHQQPSAAELVARELPSESANGIEPWVIIQAGERLGFKVKTVQVTPQRLAHLHLPFMVEIKDGEGGAQALGLITAASQGRPTLESTAKKSFARVGGFAERMGYELVGANYAKRVA